MDGAEIRSRREARGWSQADLARELRVSPRTVGAWERGEAVPKNRAGMLRAVLFDRAPDSHPPDPWRSASDQELLTELLRRAMARERHGDGRASG